jgi:hypothetical protein
MWSIRKIGISKGKYFTLSTNSINRFSGIKIEHSFAQWQYCRQ